MRDWCPSIILASVMLLTEFSLSNTDIALLRNYFLSNYWQNNPPVNNPRVIYVRLITNMIIYYFIFCDLFFYYHFCCHIFIYYQFYYYIEILKHHTTQHHPSKGKNPASSPSTFTIKESRFFSQTAQSHASTLKPATSYIFPSIFRKRKRN